MSIRLALRGRLAALGSCSASWRWRRDRGGDAAGHLVAASFSSTHGHSNTTRLNVSSRRPPGSGSRRSSVTASHSRPPARATSRRSAPRASSGWCCTRTASRRPCSSSASSPRCLADPPGPRHRRPWLHAVPLVALPQIVVYGWLPVELQVVMVAAALTYRYCWRPGPPGPARAARRAGGLGVTAAGSGGLPGRASPATAARDPAGARSDVSAETRWRADRWSTYRHGDRGGPDLRLTVLVSRWLQPAGAGALFELIAHVHDRVEHLRTGRRHRADALDLPRPRRRRPARSAGSSGRAAAGRGRRRCGGGCHLGGGARAGPCLPARPAPRRSRRGHPVVAPLVSLGALSSCLVDGPAASAGRGRSWRSRGWASRPRASSWCSPRCWPGWACTAPSSPGASRSRSAWWPARSSSRSSSGPRSRRVTLRSRAGPRPPARGTGGAAGRRVLAVHRPRAFQATFQVIILWLDILLVGAMVSRLRRRGLRRGQQARRGRHVRARGHQARDRPAAQRPAGPPGVPPRRGPVPDRDPVADAGLLAAVPGVRHLPRRGARHLRVPLHGGAAALAVLSLAMLVNLGTGNVTVVLLMGGKSPGARSTRGPPSSSTSA